MKGGGYKRKFTAKRERLVWLPLVCCSVAGSIVGLKSLISG